MPFSNIFKLCIYLLLIFISTSVFAANQNDKIIIIGKHDVDYNNISFCNVELRGEIKRGDLETIKRTFSGFDGLGYNHYTICLDSPGGNYLESINIAEWISDNGIGTVLPEGAECLSACAILFMSGSLNTESDIGIINARYMHPLAKLGFHAPYILLDDRSYEASEVEKAFAIASTVISYLIDLSDKMNFDASLIAELLKKSPEDFFEIDTVDKIGRWNISLIDGNKTSFGSLKNACVNYFAWHGYRRTVGGNRWSNSSEEHYDYDIYVDDAPNCSDKKNKDANKYLCVGYSEWIYLCQKNKNNIEIFDHEKKLIDSFKLENWTSRPPSTKLVDLKP